MTAIRGTSRTAFRILLFAAAVLPLVGCTTLLATTSIEPYTKVRESRDRLELLAEDYCRQKRGPGAALPEYLFTTDGCTRSPDDGYAACCIVHDIAYWCGGSAEDRKEADGSLERCLDEKGSGLGGVYYFGTRVGGMPWLPTPWRWGYGWEWPKGYESLVPHQSVDGIFEALGARSLIEQQLGAPVGWR